jgi:hypothetical protein
MPAQGAQSGSAKFTMAQSRSSIETYYFSTLERPELPTKTAEPWWPLRFADVGVNDKSYYSQTYKEGCEADQPQPAQKASRVQRA